MVLTRPHPAPALALVLGLAALAPAGEPGRDAAAARCVPKDVAWRAVRTALPAPPPGPHAVAPRPVDGLRAASRPVAGQAARDRGTGGIPGASTEDQPPPSGVVPGQTLGALRGRIEVRLPALGEARPLIAALGMPPSTPAADRRRSVVYLEIAPRAAFEGPTERRARMDQRNEAFVPHVLAVTIGTVVDFPNNDATYHNVFSLSRAKRFDLGRYASGRSKSVTFDRPGIVRVFCDIHSHMNAFILVFAHRFFAVTDEHGRYRIDGIPPGTYTVNVWNEALPLESRAVTIGPGGVDVELDVVLGRSGGSA